jgi:hypothetical protein
MSLTNALLDLAPEERLRALRRYARLRALADENR